MGFYAFSGVGVGCYIPLTARSAWPKLSRIFANPHMQSAIERGGPSVLYPTRNNFSASAYAAKLNSTVWGTARAGSETGKYSTAVARAETRNPQRGDLIDQVCVLRASVSVQAGAARRGRAEYGAWKLWKCDPRLQLGDLGSKQVGASGIEESRSWRGPDRPRLYSPSLRISAGACAQLDAVELNMAVVAFRSVELLQLDDLGSETGGERKREIPSLPIYQSKFTISDQMQ
jgi:hypothetical protein